jgi:hypothetical protein
LGGVVVGAGGFGLLAFLLATHCLLAARGSASFMAKGRFCVETTAGAAAAGDSVPLDVLGNRSPNGRRAPPDLWVRLKQPEAGSKPMVDDAGAAWSSSMASIHASQSTSSSATWAPWPGVARSNASTDDPTPAQLVLFGGQAPVGSWWA